MDRSPFFFGFFSQKVSKKIVQKIYLFAAARDCPLGSNAKKLFKKYIYSLQREIVHDVVVFFLTRHKIWYVLL